MQTTDRYRRQLLQRLKVLGERLSGIEEELLSHSDRDWEEQAQEQETDEVLENLGLAGQKEIRQIRAALERIDNGSFGTCTSCGKEIEPERLKAVPSTPLCKTCARELAA